MPSIADALTSLHEHFGFPDFREGQREVVTAILEGKDAVVVMPTGSGKSLCYQLPAMMLDGATVVVSPLIALMKDQVDALHARGLPATFINSSIDRRNRERESMLSVAAISNWSMLRRNVFAAADFSKRSSHCAFRFLQLMRRIVFPPGATTFVLITCG